MTAPFNETPSPSVVAALVENHRRFLAFLQKRVGNRADAEEILQEAFAKGLARAGEIRDEERADAWFYRLLRNAVVDHWWSHAAVEKGPGGARPRVERGSTAPGGPSGPARAGVPDLCHPRVSRLHVSERFMPRTSGIEWSLREVPSCI